MIYSSWDIEQNILKLAILGHFLPFYPLKNPPKSKFWKLEKFAGDVIILHVYQKSQSYDVRFLRYRVRQTEFFDIMGHYLPFDHPHSHLPNNPKNQNFEKKNEKNAWRCYPFRARRAYVHATCTWRGFHVHVNQLKHL